jgi:hypothetical protein
LEDQRGDVSVLVNLGTDDHEFRVCGVRLLAGSEPAVQTTGPVVRVPPDAAAVVERRASGGQP